MENKEVKTDSEKLDYIIEMLEKVPTDNSKPIMFVMVFYIFLQAHCM